MSSVGRNSVIMASGTLASRLTGQIRTILLAAAIGTTGIAANAYQTGSMIPQVLFTLLSGGIFNAVLVPQIVRTLKNKNASQNLDKLITLSITLLAGVMVVMMLGTHLLTTLYLDSSWSASQQALVDSFTLWCMPQIFFYGLYTILGQILAAQGHFGAYAWSSTGANVISCIGFGIFIAMFGNVSHAKLSFWTIPRTGMIAGMWTLGVAFQALVLFTPMLRTGYRFHWRWGIHGIGLRSMGTVAVWSLGIVAVNQIVGIITARIANGAPLQGNDLYGIAGNGTYQNAYSIYILPYSLIAVSLATAIFPQLSRYSADNDIDSMRETLSGAIRNVILLLTFCTAVLIAIPVPIIKALLPSVSASEIHLISYPLITLSLNLVMISVFLLIQRTFYAFEDGRSPFMFALLQNSIMVVVLMILVHFFSPATWVTSIGLSSTIGYVIALPVLFWLLSVRHFNHNVDVKRILILAVKSLAAGAATWFVSKAAYTLLVRILHLPTENGVVTMGWITSLLICVVVAIIAAIIYFGVLFVLRTQELTSVAAMLVNRLHLSRFGFGKKILDAAQSNSSNKSDNNAKISNSKGSESTNFKYNDADSANIKMPVSSNSSNSSDSSNSENSKNNSELSAIPVYKMTSSVPIQSGKIEHKRDNMELEPGTTLLDRYELVKQLRSEPGIAAWIAQDKALDQKYQLFVVTNTSLLDRISSSASSLVLSRNRYFTAVRQIRYSDNAAIVVSDLDSGISLRDYLAHYTSASLSIDAIRTIIGEVVRAAQSLKSGEFMHHSITDAVIRLSKNSVTVTDFPVSAVLTQPAVTRFGENLPDGEELAVRQIAVVLYQLITGMHYIPQDNPTAQSLLASRSDTPSEFVTICSRALGLRSTNDANDSSTPIPMATLLEFEVLLGSWKSISDLSNSDIMLSEARGANSIEQVLIDEPVENSHIAEIPKEFISSSAAQTTPHEHPEWKTNELIFHSNDDIVIANSDGDDMFKAFEDYEGERKEIPAYDPSAFIVPDETSGFTDAIDINAVRARSNNTASQASQQAVFTQKNSNAAGAAAQPQQKAQSQSVPPSFSPDATQVEQSTSDANSSSGSYGSSNTSSRFIKSGTQSNSANAASSTDGNSVKDNSVRNNSAQAKTQNKKKNPNSRSRVTRNRTISIVIVGVVLIGVLAAAAMNLGLTGSSSGSGSADPWSTLESSKVRFPGSNSSSDSSSSSTSTGSSADSSTNTSSSSSDSSASSSASSTKSSKKKTKKKSTATASASATSSSNSSSNSGSSTAITKSIMSGNDRAVSSVPTPYATGNTTAITPSAMKFFSSSSSTARGYGLYITLASAQTISRIDLTTTTTSGSAALIYAGNDTSAPTNGYPLASLTLSTSGSASVTLRKPVTTDKIIIWVSYQSTIKTLRFTSVKLY